MPPPSPPADAGGGPHPRRSPRDWPKRDATLATGSASCASRRTPSPSRSWPRTPPSCESGDPRTRSAPRADCQPHQQCATADVGSCVPLSRSLTVTGSVPPATRFGGRAHSRSTGEPDRKRTCALVGRGRRAGAVEALRGSRGRSTRNGGPHANRSMGALRRAPGAHGQRNAASERAKRQVAAVPLG